MHEEVAKIGMHARRGMYGGMFSVLVVEEYLVLWKEECLVLWKERIVWCYGRRGMHGGV